MLNKKVEDALNEIVKAEVADQYDYEINRNDLQGLVEGIMFQLQDTVQVAIEDAMNVLNVEQGGR